MEQIEVAKLRRKLGDPQRHTNADIDRAKRFLARHADRALPIVIGANGEILCGAIFVEAARALGILSLTVIRQDGLNEQEELLYSIATNKLLSAGSWDGEAMERAIRDFETSVESFAADLLGFAPGELDKLIGMGRPGGGADDLPSDSQHPVSVPGSLWLLGKHRVICGDATEPETLARLSNGVSAAAAVCDPPFGCKIDGFVSTRGKHRNFVQASGEMSEEELRAFFLNACLALLPALQPGALVYLFIDWRSLALLQAAAETVFGKIVHLCIWSKNRAGMGCLYRSRHELVLVFAVPGAKHRNNIELGRHGRDRSNVWEYPCAASSRKGREGDILKLHPTPKPVEMIADVVLDCTSRGEVFIDSFLGSGTSLIAAERTGRICHGADLAPHFVDLAVRRWQRWTGRQATEANTGKTFGQIEHDRLSGEACNER